MLGRSCSVRASRAAREETVGAGPASGERTARGRLAARVHPRRSPAACRGGSAGSGRVRPSVSSSMYSRRRDGRTIAPNPHWHNNPAPRARSGAGVRAPAGGMGGSGACMGWRRGGSVRERESSWAGGTGRAHHGHRASCPTGPMRHSVVGRSPDVASNRANAPVGEPSATPLCRDWNGRPAASGDGARRRAHAPDSPRRRHLYGLAKFARGVPGCAGMLPARTGCS